MLIRGVRNGQSENVALICLIQTLNAGTTLLVRRKKMFSSFFVDLEMNISWRIKLGYPLGLRLQ